MSSDQRKLFNDDDDHRKPTLYPPAAPPYVGTTLDNSEKSRPEFNLLVVGARGGKTSFLRLLLDTSTISQKSTPDQLSSVAKFVQGCAGHTPYIRSTAIDIDVDHAGSGSHRRIGLTLIDTPSLDFKDEPAAERVVSEILRHVDQRFTEGLEDSRKADSGNRYVHLCIYFLDPDQIVPPQTPESFIPRTRNNSFSQPDQEPVILDPPVTTNPRLYRPTLPLADIKAIRQLSSRVNVLPVISRADILSNERLRAIKRAVRDDLADSGIGFGIFDVDTTPYHKDDLSASNTGDPANGYGAQPNGSGSSANNSPPMSPATPAILRLPYALISPDLFSHSDGVRRDHPSRHDLMLEYSPSFIQPPPSKFIRGKFLRSYRWGNLDVLDPAHSDFVPLRNAIFHHMETLQKYTREYLFEKFKDLAYHHQRPTSRHSLPQHPQQLPSQGLQFGRLPHTSRPILAIDTAASHAAVNHHPSLHLPRDLSGPPDFRSAPVPTRHIPDSLSASISSKNSGSRSAKQRSKKITVACNFCRSRKLKCDGGRPACGQCVKRSNPCDYQVQNKRRGTVRQSKSNDSAESDSATEERSQDQDQLYSPDGHSQVMSHRSSIFEGYTPADEPSSSSSRKPSLVEARPYFHDNELPHIATLSLPSPSPSTPVPMSAPSLPPIRPASEQQAAQRKRAATVPGKSTRQPSTSGPKVVACNFCRARKTKCDGGHPSCSSCARRSLACNYVHDNTSPNGPAMKKISRRASTSKAPTEPSNSPTSSRMIPTPSSINGGGYDPREDDIKIEPDMDLKRTLDHPDLRPMKKMRMDIPAIPTGIP